MKQAIKSIGFTLLIIGTICLLLNEFFDWGRSATLTFAAVNVLGFVALAYAHWGIQEDKKSGV